MRPRSFSPDLSADLGPVVAGAWRHWRDAPLDPGWIRADWQAQVYSRLEAWSISDATSLFRADAMVTACVGVGLLSRHAEGGTMWCASRLLVYADRWGTRWARFTPHRVHLDALLGEGDQIGLRILTLAWRKAAVRMLPPLVAQLWHDAGLWNAGAPLPQRALRTPWPVGTDEAHPTELVSEVVN